jgi:hypothetical protein
MSDEKMAEWYCDMNRSRSGTGRYIRIEVPRDIDDVELKFIDEFWTVTRSVIEKMSRKRMFRKAVEGDFGAKWVLRR